MQLIAAKITGKPRNVNTKHGDQSVVDARANNGENLTIWRQANDPEVMRLANGERVQLAIDSKGKVSLVDTAFSRAEETRTADFTVEPIEQREALLAMVRSFNEGNDPYGEHDFGAIEFQGKEYFWKIDYYADDSYEHGTEDPGSPLTRWVMTIMHSSEY